MHINEVPRRQVAVAKHLGLQLLRIADAVILPLNTSQYAYELDYYLNKYVPTGHLFDRLFTNYTLRVEDIAGKQGFDADFSALRGSIQNLQKASVALDEEKNDAEKTLKKLVKKWWKLHHRHGRLRRFVRKWIRKIKAWLKKEKAEEGCTGTRHIETTIKQLPGLGESGRLRPRVGRYPAWLREQQEKETHSEEQLLERLKHHWTKRPKLAKQIIAAAKRVRAANQKLTSFERGFISEEGIKDREWYRNLAVAPGKWLGQFTLLLSTESELTLMDVLHL